MTTEAQPNPPSPEARPEWLLPKFKTVEDQARSYAELERKLGSQVKAPPKVEQESPAEIPKGDGAPEQTPENAEADDASGLVLEAGEPSTPEAPPVIDREAERKAVASAVQKASSGQIDPETLETLERAGINRETIDAIAGRLQQGSEALRQLAAQEATKEIGGLEEWAKVEDWAKDNLAPPDLEAFNNLLGNENPTIVRVTVQALHRQMLEAQGPQLIDGSGSRFDGGDIFTSREQIMQAQSDPRYESDPAFRDAVVKKIMRTDFAKLIN